MSVPPGVEYPPKADLRKDVYRALPRIVPGTVNPAAMSSEAASSQAQVVLDAFNAALGHNDVDMLASCFYAEQAFWRDIVALTGHLRSFAKPKVVAAALLHTIGLRGIAGTVEFSGNAHFAVMGPTMGFANVEMFIDCGISFQTNSPALGCSGKLLLLPVKPEGNGSVLWKIWVLSTWIETLSEQPEDEAVLSSPGKNLDANTINTDVFIVGAGSSGLAVAARLKALGVESIVVDRNKQIGDNWTRRYDCLEFHVPTSNCEMPYTFYAKELQSPHRLTKDEVATHLHDYATKFHLNVILCTSIVSTKFDTSQQKWTIKLNVQDGKGTKTIVSRHFVQATGLGSGKPHFPAIQGAHLYHGVNLHSTGYRNARILAEQGVKSVAVIGSANTAFDIIQDCHNAGLQTTMVARSPTYVFPYDYMMDSHGIGAYDVLSLDAADRLLNTMPGALDGQFSHALFSFLASQQLDRYLALSKAGFPVLDSRDPSVDVQHHLFERGGGHYIDVGGTELIAEGKVAVRGLVEPVGFTESGLLLSDGTTLDADAVVWCTGFADKNVRATASELLGEGNEPEEVEGGDILGPTEVAARLDATWGVDAEGEVRGVWKRHLRMENYWVIGGVIQHQRWWSRPLAQQIKLALLGSLPPAYRDTPEPTSMTDNA
ncbi:putative FAD/NAD(P)-binding domain-containing protein [Seiridium cardinale]